MDSIVGKNLKSLRLAFGYSQKAVATYLGINTLDLSLYEEGEKTIPSDKLSKLATLYSVEEFDLFQESELILENKIECSICPELLTSEDLNSIAWFRKIAMNYHKMNQILVQV